jgi:ABC transporter substrate binding protein
VLSFNHLVSAGKQRIRDEISERLRRQIGPADDRHRRLRDEADRRECRLRIVGKLAIELSRSIRRNDFVASLNRPGGNATGVALLTSVLVTKRLQLIRELVPTATLVAILANPNSPESGAQLSDIEVAAQSLGQQIHFVDAASDGDFDTSFSTLSRQQFGALVVTTDAFFYSRHYQMHTAKSASTRVEFSRALRLRT